jgi:hypothetical protein
MRFTCEKRFPVAFLLAALISCNAVSQALAVTLVSTGAVWRYFDQSADLGTTWRNLDYNDHTWQSGAAQLGFGDGDEATLLGSNSLRVTTYFRHVFAVTNVIDALSLRLLRDDGAVVYLNGTEVFRSNMPTGTVQWGTFASLAIAGPDETNFVSTNLSAAALQTGLNVLAVEVHQANTNSTDLSFDLELTGTVAPAETLTEALVPRGAVWKYLDNGSNPPTNWHSLTYNDDAWPSGPARLGYGGDGEITTVSFGPNSNTKYITTYFRHNFLVTDASIFQSLKPRVVRDDGAILYLNGTEIFRSNMPTGTVGHLTNATATVGAPDELSFFETNASPAALRNGTNVFAAEVHQSGGTSGDLGFDPELLGEYVAAPRILSLAASRDLGNGQVVVAWPRPAVGYALQSRPRFSAANQWTAATNPVLIAGANNTALVRTNNTNEFFRLRRSVVDASTLSNKMLFGYQGWFACTNDGSPPNRWVHWFRNGAPYATNATVDFWPDVSELDNDELFHTAMNLSNGAPARVYAAYKTKTVVRHFKWMQDAGIDGVFLQRFTSELSDPAFFDWRNQITYNCRAGAEAYGRVFAVMYDISGQNSNTLVMRLTNDWLHISGTMRLTSSSRYLRHKGKPVVAIWGLGFTDRPGTAADAQQVIDWFKAMGCTVMGGVPTNWRNLSGDSKTDPAWAVVYRSFDIISPWSVGRYSSDSGADTFKQNYITPDLTAARLAGRDYLPVIWPGFSWKNLTGGALNQIPRRGGRFWWRQLYNAQSAGCNMIYGAMFDEVDEGTAMFKMAPTAAELPAQGTFVPLNIDGEALPSDWYLRLAGEGSKMLRGEIPLTSTRPINP